MSLQTAEGLLDAESLLQALLKDLGEVNSGLLRLGVEPAGNGKGLFDRPGIVLAAVFVRISLIRKECLHGCYNAVSAGRALLTVFDGETVVDHLLYISAVLGEHKPFEMICICEHRIQLWRHRLPARADSGR